MVTARPASHEPSGPTAEDMTSLLAGMLVGDPVLPDETTDAVLRLMVASDSWREAAVSLHDAGVDRLEFLTCVDWDDHFVLTLQVYAPTSRLAVRLAAELPRDRPTVSTVSDLWPSANWEERETFDQFGVVFEGHPDLRRILNPEAWVGHPLQRDYVDDVHITRPQYF